MFDLEPLHPLLGARVRGVDLRRTLSDALFAALREAFRRYSVLVFPDQPLGDDEQIAFSRRFGPLEATRTGAIGAGSPVVHLGNIGADGEIVAPDDQMAINARANQLWHSDSSFKPVPSAASALSAREVPAAGGETEFASLRAAWSALPATRQEELRGLIAIHSFEHSRAQIDPDFLSREERTELPPVHQALVRRLTPEGEECLFLGSHASHIIGWPEAEGRALLQDLLAHATAPERVLQHVWQPHDLVLWDNRCVLHRGRPWDPGSRRHMVRTTIAGDAPTVDQDGV